MDSACPDPSLASAEGGVVEAVSAKPFGSNVSFSSQERHAVGRSTTSNRERLSLISTFTGLLAG